MRLVPEPPACVTQPEGATMPPDLNDTFLITTTRAPDRRRTDLVLSGDVDMAALPRLDDAVDQIGEA